MRGHQYRMLGEGTPKSIWGNGQLARRQTALAKLQSLLFNLPIVDGKWITYSDHYHSICRFVDSKWITSLTLPFLHSLFIISLDSHNAVHSTDGHNGPGLMAGSVGSRGTAGPPCPLGRSQVVEWAGRIAWEASAVSVKGRPLVRCRILPNLAETGS